MDIDKQAVGQLIKSIRLSLGYTMREFGGKFSPLASDSVVSRWERGKSIPNPKRLSDIAFYGQISVDELLYGRKEPCVWKQDHNGLWVSSCDLTWEFEDGSSIPSNHQMHYCPKCGRELNERGT